MSELGIETVGQLAATPFARLEAAFGEKEARWLAGLAVGVTGECDWRGGQAALSRWHVGSQP